MILIHPEYPVFPVRKSPNLLFCSFAIPSFELVDHLGYKQGENKQGHWKDDFQWEKFTPVPTGPDLFEGSNEKEENEGPHDDAQVGAEKVIPEMDLAQAHAKIHRREWEIDQT